MKLLLRLLTIGISALSATLCLAQPIDLIHERVQTIETALNGCKQNNKIQKRLFDNFKNEVEHLQLELDVLLFTLEHFENRVEVPEENMQLFMNNLHNSKKAVQCFQRLFAEKRDITQKLETKLFPLANHHPAEGIRLTARQLAQELMEQRNIIDYYINRVIDQMMNEKNPNHIRCA